MSLSRTGDTVRATPPRDVPLVYVLGASRSGTTLVGMVVESRYNALNVGEAFRQLLRQTDRFLQCTCGSDVLECGVWSVALHHVAKVRGLNEASAFWDVLVHAPTGPARVGTVLDPRALYEALRHSSATSFIIDTSKSPDHARMLSDVLRGDVTLMHLVRDVRGVFWSRHRGWRRRLDSGRPPSLLALTRLAAYWWRVNLTSALVGRRHCGTYVAVRYEDLVTDIEATLDEIMRPAATPTATPTLTSAPSGGYVVGSGHHSLAGNPISRSERRLIISADEEWRTSMPRWARIVLYVLCWPLCRKYGYRL